MSPKSKLSNQTRRNWWIDALLATSAVLAALSGIYFLFFPRNGFQGGRNPLANIIVLFERATWDDLHTWSGIVMISVVLIHLTLHWSWVVSMTRRTWKALRGQASPMNGRGRFNLIINIIVALGFLLCAVSGIYLLFVPGGRGAVDPQILFSRITWDLIHTWSAVILIVAALIHFAIHWSWVTKVTRGVVAALNPVDSINYSNAKRLQVD